MAALGHRKRLLRSIAALNGCSLRYSAGPMPAPGLASRDAERRQLTVMFCDLVGSTALSGRLDPEDLQHLIRSYHEAVAPAVAPFDGHVAQFLGDGVLVYFGYPRAHEDDAERARALGARHRARRVEHARAPGAASSCRRASASPPAWSSSARSAPARAAAERSASGETPNLAARLQAQAAPGEIVLSRRDAPARRRLVRARIAGRARSEGLRRARRGLARASASAASASRFEAQHDAAA